MCKNQNIKVDMTSLDFNIRGKMNVHLSDGRSISCPVAMFPDVKRIPVEERKKKWTILEGQYITFIDHYSAFLSIEDIMKIN